MAVAKKPSDFLPYNTKVELVAINKTTHQTHKKIIELHEFSTMNKNRKFNYYLYQIGFSQYNNQDND